MKTYDYIGIDVAKDKFDACINGRNTQVFNNDKKGLKKFITWSKKYSSNIWICMEATGSYSEQIADFLLANNIHQISVVNPMQIKNFFKAKLLRNKNDLVDARGISEYARVMQPRLYIPRTKNKKELCSLTNILNTLKKQHTQLKNQLGTVQGSIAKQELTKIIRALEKRIKSIESEALKLIKSDDAMLQQYECITSIPGVGIITAFEFISVIRDVNQFKHAKEFAAFCGVTPRQNQSGKFNGKSHVSKVGHSRLRRVLYMASLSAKRYNPSMAECANNLLRKNKPAKVILCAIMRKLAHLIFILLRNNTSFIKGHQLNMA